MKKAKMKKITSVIVSLALIISSVFISPIIAGAVSTPPQLESTAVQFWADPENTLTQNDLNSFNSGTNITMVGAVGVYARSTSSTNYYLFLPSSADCNNLKVWFNASTASIDSTIIKSGEPTNAFADIAAGGVSKTYTLDLDGAKYSVTAMKSGDIGAVYVDTTSGSISNVYNSNEHDSSEAGTIMVIDANGNVNYDGALDKIQGRGNGTWGATNKRPFNIKLGVSTSLLGMSKAKKWCLLANEADETLIKDQLTYDFADYIGIKYQPHCKPVDLYVNQQYLGSYQLSEKVEIKSNRLNISDAYENLEIANGTTDATTGVTTPADLSGTTVKTVNSSGQQVSLGTGSMLFDNTNSQTVGVRRYSDSLSSPSDVTGGYLYELEISQRWIEENAGFCAYNRQGWVIKNCDYATPSMVNYSYDLLYALGSAVYNGGVVPNKSTTTSTPLQTVFTMRTTTNPAPATEYQNKKWSDILDADSAVRYYWTQEYFKNMDSSTSSTYFYKDSDSKDSKLYAGPMWDMDNTIMYNKSESRWGCDLSSPEGWYTKNARIYRFRSNDSSTKYSKDSEVPLNFYAALATNCSDFWAMAETYWYSTIEPATQILLGNATDPKGILHSTEYYVKTVEKSNAMDNLRLNLNSDKAYDSAAVIKSINNWFTSRNNWIDSQIAKTDIANATVTIKSVGKCTGTPIVPNYTVTYNGNTLIEGADYTAEYSNNVQASAIAKITLTGKGKYTGTKTALFTINSGTLVGGSASIPETAYAGDTLSVDVKNADGIAITDFVTYQWQANGTNISGANSKEYTVTESDKGKTLTVKVGGDGSNVASIAITSNSCAVSENNKQLSYTKTLASWNYDYTADSSALTSSDGSGNSYYYFATSGENASTAKLTASVNSTSSAPISWSGTADLYYNPSTSAGTDQTPVIATSKTDGIAWGEYPYFNTVVSTAGYENIHFSARLGGTKKGPRDWKLQYSVDGANYKDVENASYSITKNKSMELAFDDIALPAECNNKSAVYIRMVVSSNVAINGINTIVGQKSGDAAVNNIAITGASTSAVTALTAPQISTSSTNGDSSVLFDTDTLTVADTNGGADVYYSVNGGEDKLYSGSFNPFDSASAKIGDKATITAYAKFEDIKSDTVTYTATFGGVNIINFDYSDYSQNVSNGAVFSTGGVYGKSGKMTAYTDGKSQFVPLWKAANNAYCVAPDDGALWSSESGFTFEISTAGYTGTAFTCKAYTTASGPKSVSPQYSLDGKSWTDVKKNIALPANGALEQFMLTESLPSECDNKTKVYVRLATTENSTSSGLTLHNNASKGNLYVNSVYVSGEDSGDYKMPYTEKTSDYFGLGAIKYISPDNKTMHYIVTDSSSKVLLSGEYPSATGIVIANAAQFNPNSKNEYKVTVWEGDVDDKSQVNSRNFYYKGDTVTKFSYNDSKRLLSSYISPDEKSATNTSGANAGTIAMYPDSSTPATLSYTNTYGVKVSASATSPFAATKSLDNPSGNGYWLIKTSTKGFTDLTLTLEQLSSNKGPRDWGLAYSTDGKTYTYVASSNVRAISNDSATSTVETYNNFALPSACDDQSELYLKIFINGGEAVSGDELELYTSGNTGMNGIEICGIAKAKTVQVAVTTVGITDKKSTVSNLAVDSTITVDGVEYKTTNGVATIPMTAGETYEVTASANGTFARTVSVKAAEGAAVTIPIVCVDLNGDGIVNGKDFARALRISDAERSNAYQDMLYNLLNIRESTFTYADLY